MKILSPKAAKELNLKSIPDFVFEAFNNLLIKKLRRLLCYSSRKGCNRGNY